MYILWCKTIMLSIKELFRRLFGKCEECGKSRTESFYCIDRQRDVDVCDKCFERLLNEEFYRGE